MLEKLFRQVFRYLTASQRPQGDLGRITELLRAGQVDTARVDLTRYLDRRPDDAQALHLGGLIELQSNRPDAAVTVLARAVKLDPEDAVCRANFALALRRSGDLGAALAEYETAVGLSHQSVEPFLNLAEIHAAQGNALAARATLERALGHATEMAPADVARVWVALAGLEAVLPEIDAPDCLKRAAQLDPQSDFIPLLGYMAYARRCDWSFATDRLVEFFERDAAGELQEAIPLFAPGVSDCLPLSRRARYRAAQRCGNVVMQRVAPLSLDRTRRPAREPRGRIRLAYLSADFHNHPTLHLMRGVLAAHDHERFEVHAYSLAPDDGTGARDEVRPYFDAFNEVEARSPLEVAQGIVDDGIDLLVDLNGYAGTGRPEIAALRPAPVQISYLGFPGSVAAGFIDYLVADKVLVRPQDRQWYSENIAYMPWTYQPTDNRQTSNPRPPSRADVGLPARGFVFCSFNSTYKLEPMIFGVWMEILRAVPDSVMWILADRDDARHNLRSEAAARGIAPARLVFAESLPRPAHLARLVLADLFLDTHFVNAHTTASDAMWAGLPLITASGESFSSRVAASVLCAAGLPDLICADIDAYRTLAIALASDPSRMVALRARCGRIRSDSALFDTHAYTRGLETAYSTMHARFLAGQPPSDFHVPAGAGAQPC